MTNNAKQARDGRIPLLEYKGLQLNGFKRQYTQLIESLAQGNFQSVEVQQIIGTPYCHAKLDARHRLLFQPVQHQQRVHLLMLERIAINALEHSRFLKGAPLQGPAIDYDALITPKDPLTQLKHLSPDNPTIHLLDKMISFDLEQRNIYDLTLPVLIIGSAGSGKTMLTLEKIKQQAGELLYVTHSSFLAKNARRVYYANDYTNDAQSLEFFSYQELLETLEIPNTRPVTPHDFARWARKQHTNRLTLSPSQLFEEFQGVITGSQIDAPYLSLTDYLALGIKQSIFSVDEREVVYSLFLKYLSFLEEAHLHDLNILSTRYLTKTTPRYDGIIVDEVQDFTAVQLHLVLSLLTQKENFLLCGDANQIVHPNFFSWAKVKSYFYKQNNLHQDIARVLTRNYRNSTHVTELSNRILKLKNLRFGSIDKESHYLIESSPENRGMVQLVTPSATSVRILNDTTQRSIKTAIITLNEQCKREAKQIFNSPLIFTIQEAKGLEYENVLLYNFIKAEPDVYTEICRGLSADHLNDVFAYGRVKDKSDKSLEIYKFFINALYVAITRAIKNVYWVDEASDHCIFDTLGLTLSDIKQLQLSMTEEASSLQEWQAEATKLEAQGKVEQAHAIREQIIKTQTIPWTIIDKTELSELKMTAVCPTATHQKQVKIRLLEYATAYEDAELIRLLKNLNFKGADKPDKAKALLDNQYFMGYKSNNYKRAVADTIRYGIDFRNLFNWTPLMIATLFGNLPLIQYLISQGANPALIDNWGRNALRIALGKACSHASYRQQHLADCYQALVDDSLQLRVDNKLIKLGSHTMEFFLLNVFMAILKSTAQAAQTKAKDEPCAQAFSAIGLSKILASFPGRVLRESRKKRSYISAMLSKNEHLGLSPYNRKIFMRVAHGHYTINPALSIKIQNQWVPIYECLDCEFLAPDHQTWDPDRCYHMPAFGTFFERFDQYGENKFAKFLRA